MKKTVLCDSSSALLLYKAGIFEKVHKNYSVMTCLSVWEELCNNSYSDGMYFMNFFSPGVNVFQVDSENIPLKGAERELIQLYKENRAGFILIDDKKAAKYCFSNNISFTNALLMNRVLYVYGLISESNYTAVFARLVCTARYSKWIIDFVNNCGNTELQRFAP